jgi:hypothetical protein
MISAFKNREKVHAPKSQTEPPPVLLLSAGEKELLMTLFGNAERLQHFHRMNVAAAPFRRAKIELGATLRSETTFMTYPGVPTNRNLIEVH